MRKIQFVVKVGNMEIVKTVNYPDATTDEVIQRDYNDYVDAVNKGYWEDV